MTQYCSDHGTTPLKKIPAGVSRRTGKKYNAFMGCSVPGCKFTMPVIDEEPGANSAIEDSKKFGEEIETDYSGKVDEAVEEFTKEVEGNDDSPMKKSEWRRKDEQIARLTLAKSFISQGIDFDTAKKDNDLEKWIMWVLKG